MQEVLASEIMVPHSSSILCTKASDMVLLHRCTVGNPLPPPMNLCMIVWWMLSLICDIFYGSLHAGTADNWSFILLHTRMILFVVTQMAAGRSETGTVVEHSLPTEPPAVWRDSSPSALSLLPMSLQRQTTAKLCQDSTFGNSVWHCVDRINGFISVKKLATFGYVLGVFLPRKFKLIFWEF
jgi:hypothetical protein